MSRTESILLTVGVSLITLVGDYFLKRASQMPSPFKTAEFFAGVVVFALVSVGWVIVFPQLKLASVGLIYGVSTVVFTALVGWLAFNETLTPREFMGLALGVGSILLLNRPE